MANAAALGAAFGAAFALDFFLVPARARADDFADDLVAMMRTPLMGDRERRRRLSPSHTSCCYSTRTLPRRQYCASLLVTLQSRRSGFPDRDRHARSSPHGGRSLRVSPLIGAVPRRHARRSGSRCRRWLAGACWAPGSTRGESPAWRLRAAVPVRVGPAGFRLPDQLRQTQSIYLLAVCFLMMNRRPSRPPSRPPARRCASLRPH